MEQKMLVESFCNKLMQKTANREVNGNGSMVFKEAKRLIEEVWE